MDISSYKVKINTMSLKELVDETVYTASIHTSEGMKMHEEVYKLLLEKIEFMQNVIHDIEYY